MNEVVVLLAVTKMRAGFCLAGVAPETGRWIRPIKEFGGLQAGDVTYADGTALRVFDRVEICLGKPRPAPPHVEDWTCDFIRERPRRLDTLDESARAALLKRVAEADVAAVTNRHERSLALTPVSDLDATFALDPATGKLTARLVCPALGLTHPVPVTDLRWRALGRARYAHPQGRVLSLAQLRADLGIESVYLALGLSREFEGRLWPLVVGVHCVPDYDATVDLANP